MLLSWLYELTPEGNRTDRRSPSGTGEVDSACHRTDPRLHHHRGSAAGYCNAGRWATPVLQADRRVDFSEKHRRPSVQQSEQGIRKRLFRRWHAGRNFNGPGQGRRSESDQPLLSDAIQERREA
jgi:hypothetical protein